MTDEHHKPPSADDLAAAVVDELEASGNGDGYEAEEVEDTVYDEGDFDEPEDYAEESAEEAEQAFLGGDDLPSTGLLSFYDRLRERVLRTVDRKGGKLGAGTVRLLLLAPDLFMLLVRLALDKEVPGSTRALVGGALAYFLLPMDLLPEALLGVGAYVDDVVLAGAVVSQVFSSELEPYVRRHWSGSEDLRGVLQDIAGVGRSLLGESLYERLKDLLAKRGVEVEEEERGGGSSGFADLDDETGRAGS